MHMKFHINTDMNCVQHWANIFYSVLARIIDAMANVEILYIVNNKVAVRAIHCDKYLMKNFSLGGWSDSIVGKPLV